jgi:DNA-binding CsgD family transcriptional regulator
MALLEGLTGNAKPMAHHIGAAERIAEELRAPLLGLSTAELRVEYCYGAGEWDRGIATGEGAISLARALNQKTILARLLVWTALIYLGRGDYEKATPYIDEAWELSDASNMQDDAVLDIYAVVPAHIGRAALHMSKAEYHDAIRVGEAALALADRSGYVFWAFHRLLPIIAESYGHLTDIEGATRYEARLRQDSERLGHRFGLAWADTLRAIIHWMKGDLQRAATLLRSAAESLEAIPNIPDAARTRRQLAGRLADLGDRDGALLELRRVHGIFEQLGAQPELQKARGMFREIDARPPSRAVAEGAEGLTAREVEIATLVAARKSNKSIGRMLDISPRTVSTHLSNVFRKLGVTTRAELTDYVRTHSLDSG